ncbi:MAG TPA: response regulator [Gemmatimonadaceae bacterium]|jgi:DNA-binding NtrC family response regulator
MMAMVLYVDDEDAIRRAVSAWLTRRGHTVHTAATLTDARDLLASQAIDGAFVDVWLGDESGLELQDWVDENRPDLSRKIVFVTGDPVASDTAQRALGKIGRPVLAKPFELQQLDTFVERWMAPPPRPQD